MLRGLWYLLSMTGIPRLIFRLMLDRRVPFRLKLLLPAAIAYIILPFDLVPDFIPWGLGRFDDLLALVGAGLLFMLLTPREVLMDVSGSPQQDGTRHDAGKGKKVIDGEFRRLDD
jgi:carbonic anhydrase